MTTEKTKELLPFTEDNANFVQVIPQSKEEKVAMYMKHSKKELIEMLLNCQEMLDPVNNKCCDTCISCHKVYSSFIQEPISVRCLRSGLTLHEVDTAEFSCALYQK